jgi:hypothetical protein
MLISDSHKFVFHHIPKTAGSSITSVLAKYCRGYQGTPEEFGYSVGPPFKKVGNYTYPDDLHCGHWMHEPVRNVIDDIPKGYFSFAFVRNPIDLLLSAFYSNDTLYSGTDFYEFVCRGPSSMKEAYKDYNSSIRLLSQYEFLTDGDGNMLVDRIGLFSNLNKDFSDISSIIGIEKEDLPVWNKGNRVEGDISSHITPEIVKAINDFYEKDMEYFGC